MRIRKSWIPGFLRPDFTLPTPIRSRISEIPPPVPHFPGPRARRIWGFIHRALYHISERYCSFFDIPFDATIMDLPFGLVLKCSDRTTLEEAVSMRMARAAGMPVPKLLCCGESPGNPFNRVFSMLMTRLPGTPLNNSADELDVDAETPWIHELKKCVDAMRQWKAPSSRISSVIWTSIRSSRVPDHIMGPFANGRELHEYLLSAASAHGFESKAEYEETLLCAKKLELRQHQIMFTHGDFKAHNILVDDDNHLSGFLDWESAGWCPEYWEFTTAMRFGRGSWWYHVASWMGGDQYPEELKSDIALNRLTVDSYISM